MAEKVLNGNEDIIIKSPYPDIEPVKSQIVPQFIWTHMRKWSKATCLECGVSGRSYTYEQVFGLSRRFAAALFNANVESGDIVALVLPNIPEYAIALFGAWEAGCIVSPVNPAYAPPEIIHQIQHSEAKHIITVEPFIPVMKAAKEALPIANVIVISPEKQEGFMNFGEMLKTEVLEDGVAKMAKWRAADVADSIALLPFSSGTTGPPKGVMLTHSNLATNVLQYTQPDIGCTHSFEEGRSQEVLIGLLPFFHAYGLACILLSGLYQGSKIVTLSKFEPPNFIKAIRQYKPTVLHLVTPLVSFIVSSAEFGKDEFANCHAIVTGAAPVGLSLINSLLAKADKYMFFQEGYGMTEMSPISHGLNPSTKNSCIGKIGRIVPSADCKVVDVTTGKSLGPHQDGELCVRGPQVMKGYWRNEEATKAMIDSDGFLHTGDIVSYDEAHQFVLKDRLKELIKVKGFQVSPSELENILRKHEKVGDVAVIGISLDNDEAPRAYIVRKSEDLTEEDVHTFLEDKVAKFKQLKGGVEFIKAIPRASSGKILRKELHAAYNSANC